MKTPNELNRLLHRFAANLLDAYQNVNEELCDRSDFNDELYDWIKRMYEELSENYYAISKAYLEAKLNERFPIRTIDAKIIDR